MRITLVGSRHFGVTTFNTLRQHGVDIVRVVVHDGEDRLAATAQGRRDRGRGAGRSETRRGLGDRAQYRPDRDRAQPCPRHPGGAGRRQSSAASAITPRCCPGIAASPRSNGPSRKAIRSPAAPSITSPTGMDAGAIAAQEWVFVKKGETARELWERALAPLGQKLLADVIYHAKAHSSLARHAAGRGIRHQGAEPVRRQALNPT